MNGHYHLTSSSSPTGRSARGYSYFATGDPNDYAKLCVPPAGIATHLRTLFGKHAAQRFCLPVESVSEGSSVAEDELFQVVDSVWEIVCRRT